LRRQAAAVVAATPGRNTAAADPQQLLRELQLHQVETQLQHEELLAHHSSIERLRAKYTELYDSAPVGYFTLSPRGKILEVNRTAARLLKVEKEQLLQAPFAGLLAPESRPGFAEHLRQVFKQSDPSDETISLSDTILKTADGRRFDARVESVLEKHDEEYGRCCRSAVIDISRRRKAEEAHRRVLRQLVKAQEEERGRIARELHDEFGQELAALSLSLKRIDSELRTQSPARALVGQSMVNVGNLLRDLHRLVWNLRPPALDDLGLPAALQQYLIEWSKISGVPVHFHSGGLEQRRLLSEVETTLYRIAQEALTNVSKHAWATRVNVLLVLLEARRDHVGLIIEDDGKGFAMAQEATNGSAALRHFGLAGMKERAEMAAGTLDIESGPGAGTTVFVRIPITPLVRSPRPTRKKTDL
jgi:PAS domain S-box-containing protein